MSRRPTVLQWLRKGRLSERAMQVVDLFQSTLDQVVAGRRRR